MEDRINDGGPAFPLQNWDDTMPRFRNELGMSLRDWFAGQLQVDDRLVKCVRAMDDTALELFARFPEVEREDWITDTGVVEGQTCWAAMTEIEKVAARLKLEAQAIAIVRYMQADAMLRAREATK